VPRGTKDRFEILLELLDRYKQEAEKSAGAGAYLAGCVMLGAALEGSLLVMSECYRDEIERSISAPRDKRGKVKSPYSWHLWQLLDVAGELNWLPARLSPNEDIEFEEALNKGDIGDFVELVREIRNLVHPGKYVREWPGTTITEEHFEDCYALFGTAVDHLYNRLINDIQRRLQMLGDEPS